MIIAQDKKHLRNLIEKEMELNGNSNFKRNVKI